jgi:DNA-binding transcriptional MerR regulator
MNNQIFSKEELLKKVDITEKTLNEWENFNLLKPVGHTDENLPYYSSLNIEKAQKIKKLLDLGYKPNEIKRIIKKVGLPTSGNNNMEKNNNFLTVGNLAEKAGVSPRTIKHWEDKGIIEPDMRSEGGFRLYSNVYVYLCELIKDLQLFGYTLEEIKIISDYFRDFLAIQNNVNKHPQLTLEQKLDSMIQEIDKLYVKMNQFKDGIQRWDELLKNKKKEVINLISQNQKRLEKKETKNE